MEREALRLRGQRISEAKRVHGHARRGMKTPEYRTWMSMHRRCSNPSQRNYSQYGARGVTVADEWTGDGGYERFFEHVGPKPSPLHSIDRIDPARGYEPGNVRWATMREQQRNRSNNNRITIGDVTRCLAEWLELSGVEKSVFYGRRKRGWSVEEAICTPASQRVRVAHLSPDSVAGAAAAAREQWRG